MKGFLRAGHTPTLVAALLYFDVSFMAWVLLGPLAPFLRSELGLTPTQQGLVTAIPLLGGSLFRPLLGMLGERIGGKRTGLLGLMLTLLTLTAGWQFAHTIAHFYVLGFFLGIAGASFAVALPLASRWYPPEYQGLAMGIAGAGNSGTLLATLFAPRLAEHFGWPTTFGIAMLPIALVLVVLLAGVGVCVALVGTMPTVSVAVGPLFLAMALLGMGNGAVFQLVPQRFPERIGLVTGVVGAVSYTHLTLPTSDLV